MIVLESAANGPLHQLTRVARPDVIRLYSWLGRVIGSSTTLDGPLRVADADPPRMGHDGHERPKVQR